MSRKCLASERGRTSLESISVSEFEGELRRDREGEHADVVTCVTL